MSNRAAVPWNVIGSGAPGCSAAAAAGAPTLPCGQIATGASRAASTASTGGSVEWEGDRGHRVPAGRVGLAHGRDQPGRGDLGNVEHTGRTQPQRDPGGAVLP